MATIKDVAHRAGVSISTVSHVLNQTRFVSQESTQRVQEAIAELNYAPNSLARGLKLNSSKSIGMLVTTSSNPFFAEVIRGVEANCFTNGYNLILCNTENQQHRQQSYLKMLLEKRVDGLLVMCSEISQQLLSLLKTQNTPQVVMDGGWPCDFADLIQDNSRHGAYLATNHLIRQGYQEIGCLTGPMDHFQAQQRLHGFKQALREAQLPVHNEWILEGDFNSKSGFELMQQLLSQNSQPKALVTGNDLMAIGAISAAFTQDIKIPQNMAVVGYDDIEPASYSIPPLTTIRQPAYHLGEQSVQLLLRRIQEPARAIERLLLEPELVIRQSAL
ncbi:substrate-binding domain-containing protein [Dongshaea marina]|uniref:substrate-binding domain-containing protein n=1 Tax=Dongshaea marina TaxID=2047966 RepID=UPI000D3E38B0|nr:substrate-binding domain-containing protein [Dongshaea marina]